MLTCRYHYLPQRMMTSQYYNFFLLGVVSSFSDETRIYTWQLVTQRPRVFKAHLGPDRLSYSRIFMKRAVIFNEEYQLESPLVVQSEQTNLREMFVFLRCTFRFILSSLFFNVFLYAFLIMKHYRKIIILKPCIMYFIVMVPLYIKARKYEFITRSVLVVCMCIHWNVCFEYPVKMGS